MPVYGTLDGAELERLSGARGEGRDTAGRAHSTVLDLVHLGSDQLSQCWPRRNVRRRLTHPDDGSESLRATGRLHDLDELHVREPGEHLPAVPFPVAVLREPVVPPLTKRPLSRGDGLGSLLADGQRLARVGTDASVASDVLPIRDLAFTVDARPQRMTVGEKIQVGPRFAAQLGNRSSLSRKGLALLAGPRVDPGF